jgi:hypothetical protein
MRLQLIIGRKKEDEPKRDQQPRGESMISKILKHWKLIIVLILLYLLFFQPDTLSELINYVVTTLRGATLNV